EGGAANFGASVALSSAGSSALIGGPRDNIEVGAVWAFTRSGSTWTQQGSKLTVTAESSDAKLGSSVALSSAGSTALFGGAGDYNRTGAAWVFVATPPTATTEAASAVAQTSATANGTVNPNGFEVSDCHFEYGPTTAYGLSAPCAQSPGSGTSPVAVSAALESLSENAGYHFRVVATSANGTNV